MASKNKGTSELFRLDYTLTQASNDALVIEQIDTQLALADQRAWKIERMAVDLGAIPAADYTGGTGAAAVWESRVQLLNDLSATLKSSRLDRAVVSECRRRILGGYSGAALGQFVIDSCGPWTPYNDVQIDEPWPDQALIVRPAVNLLFDYDNGGAATARTVYVAIWYREIDIDCTTLQMLLTSGAGL